MQGDPDSRTAPSIGFREGDPPPLSADRATGRSSGVVGRATSMASVLGVTRGRPRGSSQLADHPNPQRRPRAQRAAARRSWRCHRRTPRSRARRVRLYVFSLGIVRSVVEPSRHRSGTGLSHITSGLPIAHSAVGVDRRRALIIAAAHLASPVRSRKLIADSTGRASSDDSSRCPRTSLGRVQVPRGAALLRVSDSTPRVRAAAIGSSPRYRASRDRRPGQRRAGNAGLPP